MYIIKLMAKGSTVYYVDDLHKWTLDWCRQRYDWGIPFYTRPLRHLEFLQIFGSGNSEQVLTMVISQFSIIYIFSRTRLIGVAALTAALNSDALFNDIRNFGIQVSTIIRPILAVLFETPISILDDQYVICYPKTIFCSRF